MICWARSGYSQRMKGKDCQQHPSESITTEHAQLTKEPVQLAKEQAQQVGEHTLLLKKLQEEALACSLIAEILTTEEFATRIKSCRATVLAWKKAGVLISGRHFTQKGKYVTFAWPLSYLRMMEDDLLSVQKTAQFETKKTQLEVKKPHKKTISQTTTNCSRIGTDF